MKDWSLGYSARIQGTAVIINFVGLLSTDNEKQLSSSETVNALQAHSTHNAFATVVRQEQEKIVHRETMQNSRVSTTKMWWEE